MKVQLDTTALRRELHKVIYDDKACAQWVREFEYTLGCWGTNDNPHPFAMSLIVEAEGYRASQSIKKMKAAVIKELGADASSEDVNKRLVEKYGEERVKTICDSIRRAKNAKKLSADGDTREGSQNVPDGSDAANLETRSSADTETLDGLTDKDERPVDGRATSKPSRTTPPQNSYGEFGNVKMTTAEFEKLVQAEGAERANALIEELSSYLASSGKRYKSHYATLLNWGRRKDTDASKGKKSFKQIERDERTNFFKDDSVVKKMMAEKMGEVG
jgi:hypothetical protein